MNSRSRSRSALAWGLRSNSTAVTSFELACGFSLRLRHRAPRRARGSRGRCGELQRGPPAGAEDAAARAYGPGMGTETVSGIARDKVDPWLADHVAGAVPPFDYRLIAGGRSNLTYAVLDSDGRRFVLRRPPLGQVLQSAHDMGREHRIITALAPTPVPVPRPLAFCGEPAVNGAPFYVMEFVDGVVVSTVEESERHLDHAARGRTGAS